MYIVIGFSNSFKTKSGKIGRLVSLGMERPGYVGYKAIEVFCFDEAIKGELSEGALVEVFFAYNSQYCNGIRVL